jgi:DNA-binding SARP family transcriptional activator
VVTEGLAIQLLGDFRVSVGSRVIDEQEWTSRLARRLVKLLALAPHHRLHREHVIDRLWSHRDPEDGANNLHKALYVARRILEPDLPPRRASSYLQLRHDLLLLEAPGGLWTDVEAFLAAARGAHARRTLQAYREALRLYTGDLVLEEHYEEWASAQRDWLSGLRVTLLVELAGVQEQAGDLSAAIETLQQAAASDPVHEEAQGLLMRLLVQTGRRHLALRQYQALRVALQRELHIEPAASLQALYQDIRDGRGARAVALHIHDPRLTLKCACATRAGGGQRVVAHERLKVLRNGEAGFGAPGLAVQRARHGGRASRARRLRVASCSTYVIVSMSSGAMVRVRTRAADRGSCRQCHSRLYSLSSARHMALAAQPATSGGCSRTGAARRSRPPLVVAHVLEQQDEATRHLGQGPAHGLHGELVRPG